MVWPHRAVAARTLPGRVREAMAHRRFFATRTSGLRLDAVARAERTRTWMGGVIPLERGVARFTLDLARDEEREGRPLTVQVLRPGTEVPEVVGVVPFEVGPAVAFDVPLDRADGDWVVLRVSDPTEPNGTPGPDGYPCNDLAVAYTSPWWLDPS